MKANRSFRKTSSRRALRGISITSVLIGLVVAAIFTKTIYDQFHDSNRKTRIDAASNEIVSMISEAQRVYGASNQYGSVTTAYAVKGGVVPSRLRVAGTDTAQNTYNGAITFAPATITTANDSLTLGYGGVKNVDCQDIVLTISNLTRRIDVGTATPKANDSSVVMATLAAACDSSDTVDLKFTFGRQ